MEAVYGSREKHGHWTRKTYRGEEIDGVFDIVNSDVAHSEDITAIFVAIKMAEGEPLMIVWRVSADTNQRFREIFTSDSADSRYRVCASQRMPVHYKRLTEAYAAYVEQKASHARPGTVLRLMILGNGAEIDMDGVRHHTEPSPIVLAEKKF